MTSVDIISGIQWEAVKEEWRAREFRSLRLAVEQIEGLELDKVDDLLFERVPPEEGKPATVLVNAFEDAAKTDDGRLLLALYVYIRCLEKWETSEDYPRIRRVLCALGEAVAALPASPTPAAKLAALAVDQAMVINQAMSVEDGLSCSCPVAVGARAGGIVKTLDELWARESADGEGLDGPWDVLRADYKTSRQYFDAVVAVAKAVEAFADQKTPGPIPELAEVLDQLDGSLQGDVYESELRAHRAAFAALGDCAALRRLWIDNAELVYIYPFAVRLDEGGTAAMDDALGASVVEELKQINKLKATARPLIVNDMWDPYGRVDSDERHFGTLIELPELTVETTAREVYPDEVSLITFKAEIRVSSLGNHYLRVTSRLTDNDVHDVNQALRRGSHAMGAEKITCEGRTSDEDRWATIAEYAEEVIDSVAKALAPGPDATAVVSAGAPFHVVLAAREISVRDGQGVAAPATSFDLESAVGASLLFHPVRHLATALEEWVRYPPPVVRNLLGQEAYAGDLVVRTDNTTIVYMPASPEWLIDEYQEMIEFTASLPALLRRWEREAQQAVDAFDDALSRGDVRDLSELELAILEVEQRIRGHLAFLRSPALCRTRGQRRFLDELWAAAGYFILETELDRRLALFAERHERIAALRSRSEERQRRWLEIVLAVLAAFSFAGVLQWIDGTFGEHPPHGWLGVGLEIAMLCVVVAAVMVAASVLRRRASAKDTRE
jgi:hypothetical protein